MKKIIIIVSLLLTLILSGILYGKLIRPDEEEITTKNYYEYVTQCPDPEIDAVVYPQMVM